MAIFQSFSLGAAEGEAQCQAKKSSEKT